MWKRSSLVGALCLTLCASDVHARSRELGAGGFCRPGAGDHEGYGLIGTQGAERLQRAAQVERRKVGRDHDRTGRAAT